MLVSLSELLIPAQKGKYAVIAPDFVNLSMLKLYITIAEKYRVPVIASYPAHPFMPLLMFNRRVAKFRKQCEAASIPVCLHLDHGKDVDSCLKAIDCGFTSVMLDAGLQDLQTNVRLTNTIVTVAKRSGVSVEAELGHVGSSWHHQDKMTDPETAASFVEDTGINALAVAIGTQHGAYQAAPRIDFERLEQIRSVVKVPLVLHGGSGTGDGNLRKVVKGGICKINVFTAIIKPYLKSWASSFNPLTPGNPFKFDSKSVESVLKNFFDVSGSLHFSDAEEPSC